jgi:hypothetical protein
VVGESTLQNYVLAMKPFEANVLVGRAKTVDAKYYAMYEMYTMSRSYTGVLNHGINLESIIFKVHI